MKSVANKMMLCLVLGILCLNLKAQDYEYKPLVKSNAYWVWDQNSGNNVYYRTVRILDEDTIINDVSYKKVVYYEYGCNYFTGSVIREEEYALGMREEDSKVYRTFPHGDGEQLLYDFSLSVGDSMDIVESEGLFYLRLVSIEDTILNNNIYKRFNFTYCCSEEDCTNDVIVCSWIEGIGNIDGLFYNLIYYVIPSDDGGNLRCYEYDGDLVYHNSDWYDGCENYLGIKGVEEDEIVFYPNPAKEYITLEAEDDIFIFNSFGQEVKQVKATKGKTIINISNLPQGIYYLKTGNKRQKLVKQ